MVQKFGDIPPLSLARRIISLLTKINGFVEKSAVLEKPRSAARPTSLYSLKKKIEERAALME